MATTRSRRVFGGVLMLLLACVLAAPAAARPQSCGPDWLPSFGTDKGFDDTVRALEVLDIGHGPTLYAGGAFSKSGSIQTQRVARWTGTSWAPVGQTPGFDVYALAVFDAGGGPELYAGGTFSGTPGYIARWNGATWSSVGGGVNGTVRALAVHDDGGGAALYAAGDFQSAGGAPGPGIARWDGSSWSALGGGIVNGSVHALAVFDAGAGPELHAAGSFSSAGGVPETSYIARWDGASWAPLATGLGIGGSTAVSIHALEVFDDGFGPALFVGGRIEHLSGAPARHVVRWDGVAWSPVGAGVGSFGSRVEAFAVFDDGAGPALYAAGFISSSDPSQNVARWDGTEWSGLASGVGWAPYALAAFEDDIGLALFVGGAFTVAGGIPSNRVARWTGSAWRVFGDVLDSFVLALATHDDGDGPALYAGGEFSAADIPLGRVGRWDPGAGWSPLGSGVNGRVRALESFDDGDGPALFAAGDFDSAGGEPAAHVARWDGASWSPLGLGTSFWAYALAVFDDGGGPALHVGGPFVSAGGQVVNHVAKWDGSSWSPLGEGLNHWVRALAVFDDGGGPALYAGGTFSAAGGEPANRIARWDGASWSPLGAGLGTTGFPSPIVESLVVFDDGTGPALIAGGRFTTAGGAEVGRIAKWDGASWSPLGSGVSGGSLATVFALAVLDDGGGPALYAGGSFGTAGGVDIGWGIARWDGSSWSALGAGLDSQAVALTVFDDGAGPALFVGGHFPTSPAGDSYIAKWGCSLETGVALCFGDTGLCPCGNAGGPGEGCANSAGAGAMISGSGGGNAVLDVLKVRGAQLKPGQPALLFAGSSSVNGGQGVAFGDGLRCAGVAVVRLGVRLPTELGAALWGPGLATEGGFLAGDTRYFQIWYRDSTALGSPCGNDFNLSPALEVTFH